MSNREGTLFVISGPSGSGKTSVCREASNRTGVPVSVSATTRAPRSTEREGIDYIFLTREEFESRIEQGWFYEHAQVYSHLYGTPRAPMDSALSDGDGCLLDIDIQGARSVRQTCPGAVLVFIVPPTLDELRERLRGRATETGNELELRLSLADREMACSGEFDHVVVNDELDNAVAAVARILELGRKNERR
ncbi:unnamed protein product [marine sediment metagenome]|uniref:Guanylate kinase n=1 Tax=marine sediment metagenome TaxID=412755 RepID=X0VQX0_9ZZZZ